MFKPDSKCDICNKRFESFEQMESHYGNHKVRPVKKEPLTYLLVLPDGIIPGGYQAAEAFSDALIELRAMHSHVYFHFLPFSYKEGELESILVISN